MSTKKSKKRKYLLKTEVKRLLKSDELEFNKEEYLEPLIKEILEEFYSKLEENKWSLDDLVNFAINFQLKRFFEVKTYMYISKRRLNEAANYVENYINDIQYVLEEFKKESPAAYPHQDAQPVYWLRILRHCEKMCNRSMGEILPIEMLRRVLCHKHKLEYERLIHPISDYRECSLVEATQILQAQNEYDVLNFCIHNPEIGAYVKIPENIIIRNTTHDDIEYIEDKLNAKKIQHYRFSYKGLAKLKNNSEGYYEEITLDHLRQGGAIQSRKDDSVCLFFELSQSDIILERDYYLNLQKTGLVITKDNLFFVREELADYLNEHDSSFCKKISNTQHDILSGNEQSLNRKAIKEIYNKITNWKYYFDNEKKNGLYNCRIGKQQNSVYYSREKLHHWLIAKGRYTDQELKKLLGEVKTESEIGFRW